MTEFNSKTRYERLAIARSPKYTELSHSKEPLFCSLTLLFGAVPRWRLCRSLLKLPEVAETYYHSDTCAWANRGPVIETALIFSYNMP